MTLYSTTLAAAGRAAFYLVELETTKRCSLTFGTAPCTASGADGARCYYSRHTCQDTANFTPSTYTWRFVTAEMPVAAAIQTSYGSSTSSQYQLLPCIASVSPISQEIDLESGFNRTEHVKVSLFNLGDMNATAAMQLPGFDREKTTRNTSTAGTFWQRWLAMWPNYKGMTVRVKRGFLVAGFATTDLSTLWTGTLENVTTDASGKLTLHCVDNLRPVDRNLPRGVGSSNVLTADHSRTATTLAVHDGTKFTDPTTLANGVTWLYVQGKTGRYELMKCTAVSGNNLTVVRAQGGTHAEALALDTPVSEVLYYGPLDGTTLGRPVAIICDLLDRCGIGSSYIDATTKARAEDVIGPVALKRLITEPKSCRELINEVGDLFQLVCYPGSSQTIEFRANFGAMVGESVGTVADASNVVAGSASLKTGDRQRLTHCRVYYDKEGDAWAGIAIAINPTTFAANYYGSGEDDVSEKKIESEWIDPVDDILAGQVAVDWVTRFQHAPLRFKWTSEQRDEAYDIGDWVDVTTADILDSHGAKLTRRCLIVSKKPAGMWGYDFEAQTTGYPPSTETLGKRYAITAPAGQADYGAATTNEKRYWYVGTANVGGVTTVGATPDDGYYLG